MQFGLFTKGVKVSDMTVSYRLTFNFRLKSRQPAEKPLLTKSMKTKGSAFAKAHQHQTTEHWSEILFNDKSTIQQFAARKQNVCRRKGRDTMRSTQLQLGNTPKSNDLGPMSCNGSADLYFLPPGRTINGKKYLELLKNKQKIHIDIH